MAAYLARTDFRINIKNVRAVMQIYLLKHTLDCALAFFINRKRFIDLGCDFRSKIKAMVIKKQGNIRNGFAHRLSKPTNVFKQIRI